MVQLQSKLKELNGAGIQVAAISYDSSELLADFAKRASIEFPLLSDKTSQAIEAYGIKNNDVRKGSRRDGIPHPGTFLIDRQGKVRAKLFYSVTKRHTPDELLEAMRSLAEPQ